MAEKNRKGGRKPERQEWKPHWIFTALYRIWMLVFGAAKIVIGALATVLIICIICGIVFVNALGDYLEGDILPDSRMVLEEYSMDLSSTIYYVDSNEDIQVLQEVYASASRKLASYDEMPEALIHAAVAIEDKRFYEHQGVDWVTTIKACARMFFGDSSMGGSTITQQLVKNVTEEDSVTVQRKVLEIFRATDLEKRYDKKLIIERYLNTIYMGNGCNGVKTAAETYFGKELQSLTIAECASLISITNNPSIFDPYSEEFEYNGELMTGQERNRYRQLLVLEQMLVQGWITEEEYEEAVDQELVFKSGIALEDTWVKCETEGCGYQGTVSTYTTDGESYFCPECGAPVTVSEDQSQEYYSWFVDTLLEDVAWALAEQSGVSEEVYNSSDTMRETYMQMISTGGYSIYATIDMDAQNAVDAVYENLDNVPTTRSGQDLNSGIVLIDNATGDIVAMSGGFGEKRGFDDFSMATDALRQTGSSIKPLTVYAPAFESGMCPATVIKDLPFSYSNGAYPLNDSRTYSYNRTLLSAITNSVNAVAMNTLAETGLEYSFYFGRDNLGLTNLLEEYDSGWGVMTDIDYGPLSLGAQTIGLTVREMSNAFASFPNDGVWREARTFTKVYDSEGNLVLDNTQETREAMSEKTADYINYCLYNAANGGTGTDAIWDWSSDIEVAGKTGTTGDDYDRWFCGYTHYYTAAVWVGFEQPEAINLTGSWYGSNPAAVLWSWVMEDVHEGLPGADVYDTSGMSGDSLCVSSGKSATSACTQDIRTIKDGFRNTYYAQYYSEDHNWGSCSRHVTVDYCMSGDGVASEYCQNFAKEGQATIQKASLVKLTQSQLNEILTGCAYGLKKSDWYRDDYIYLIDGSGNDASFKGINGNINQGIEAPYKVCTVHTKEAWEKYQADKQAAEQATAPTETAPPASSASTNP